MNNYVELLSPVGDFDCLKSAVQNGADSVYFGSNLFSARASAKNFTLDTLPTAINYAKLRNVKTHLTLNTLIKNDELNAAINIAKVAYEAGIDAIIVQDLGLAKYLIKNFPNLPIHASTQMTIYNLEGALQAQEMGFSRAVLSRELPISEIEYICQNTNIEIEVFIHGALCISYSGQCLLSSMIGGRSGNRGCCAQPCRLPYTLHSNEKLDTGYLLSTRDVCGLEFIPKLLKAGVKCFKIEGRMKTPEYVATVTKIFRKYIDLAYSNAPYIIDPKDKKELMQVFNRGGFSSGHLENNPNTNLIYPQKPNNMGLYLGKVENFNSNKGYITLTTKENLSISDTISLENETGTYTISELVLDGTNITDAIPSQTVTIGRMKGNISKGDKIYKISDNKLKKEALESLNNEAKKIPFNCSLKIKQDTPITMTVTSTFDGIYKNICFTLFSDVKPVPAINTPITKERIISQITKTKNTPYEFINIEIDLDDNLFIPSISCLNELRRSAIEKIEQIAKDNISRKPINTDLISFEHQITRKSPKTISVLLNNFNSNFDYTILKKVDRLYIPYKYFTDIIYFEALLPLFNKFDVYIYLPTISKKIAIEKILENFPSLKGFVISNISHLQLLKQYSDKYDFVANYTMNIFNNLFSIDGISTYTISPELNKNDITDLNFDSELIVYGKIPLMNLNYCLLGKSNKCYPQCTKKCMDNSDFYLKDRLGVDFKLQVENGITTIYNSKNIDINCKDLNVNSIRLDFLDESLNEIQNKIDWSLNETNLYSKRK